MDQSVALMFFFILLCFYALMTLFSFLRLFLVLSKPKQHIFLKLFYLALFMLYFARLAIYSAFYYFLVKDFQEFVEKNDSDFQKTLIMSFTLPRFFLYISYFLLIQISLIAQFQGRFDPIDLKRQPPVVNSTAYKVTCGTLILVFGALSLTLDASYKFFVLKIQGEIIGLLVLSSVMLFVYLFFKIYKNLKFSGSPYLSGKLKRRANSIQSVLLFWVVGRIIDGGFCVFLLITAKISDGDLIDLTSGDGIYGLIFYFGYVVELLLSEIFSGLFVLDKSFIDQFQSERAFFPNVLQEDSGNDSGYLQEFQQKKNLEQERAQQSLDSPLIRDRSNYQNQGNLKDVDYDISYLKERTEDISEIIPQPILPQYIQNQRASTLNGQMTLPTNGAGPIPTDLNQANQVPFFSFLRSPRHEQFPASPKQSQLQLYKNLSNSLDHSDSLHASHKNSGVYNYNQNYGQRQKSQLKPDWSQIKMSPETKLSELQLHTDVPFQREAGLGPVYFGTYKGKLDVKVRQIQVNNFSAFILRELPQEIKQWKDLKNLSIEHPVQFLVDEHSLYLVHEANPELISLEAFMLDISFHAQQPRYHFSLQKKLKLFKEIAQTLSDLSKLEKPKYHGHLCPGNILISQAFLTPYSPSSTSDNTKSQNQDSENSAYLPNTQNIQNSQTFNFNQNQQQNQISQLNQLEVVLIDFGFTFMKKYLGCLRNYKNKDQYCAPELLGKKGEVVFGFDQKSDVYSFGILMWEVLNEQKAFQGLSLRQLQRVVLEDQKRPFVKQEFEEQFGYLMRSCWQNDVLQRPSFSQVVEFLNQVSIR